MKLDDTVTYTGLIRRILPSDKASHLTITCMDTNVISHKVS